MSTTFHQPVIEEARTRLQSAAVPGAVFLLYCVFVFEYFFRLSARFSAVGMIRPTMLLFGLLALALIAHADKVQGKLKEPPVQIMLGLFVYVLVVLPFVEWPGSVVRHHLQPFVLAVSFLFFTAMVVDTDRRLKVFVLLFVALQMWRVVEPLLAYLITGELRGSTHVGGGEFAGRLSGARADVINANGLGFVIVTTLTFMHFLMSGSPDKRVRVLYYAALPLFLYALMLTSSRGAFVTLFVLLAFIFWYSDKKPVFLLVLAIAAPLAWMNMSDFHKERYLSLVSSAEDTVAAETAEGRFRGMRTEFSLGFKRPVFGHGLGTTPEAKVNQLGARQQAAHNLYAELLIEIGAIGALLFLAYLYRLHQGMRDNLRNFSKAQAEGVRVDSFQLRLNKALFVLFWVYAVYSINYFGLSQDYWYVYGGLCIAFSKSIQRNRAAATPGNEASISPDTEDRRPLYI